MTELELQGLISQDEGLHIEFKESITSNLSKEMVAFANTKGGIILIGVDDNGIIKNRSLGNGDRSKIQNFARDCDPPIDVFIEGIENQSNVLVINVKEGLNNPYRCTTVFLCKRRR
jgi:ATP-dependent DNA helicase RecG